MWFSFSLEIIPNKIEANISQQFHNTHQAQRTKVGPMFQNSIKKTSRDKEGETHSNLLKLKFSDLKLKLQN